MDKDIFAGIPREGESDLDKAYPSSGTQKKDTSASSQEDKKTNLSAASAAQAKETEDKSSQTDAKKTAKKKLTPFHKHPRWQQMQSRLKNKDQVIDDLSSQIEKLKSQFNKIEQDNQPVKVPQYFINAFGEDEKAWREFQSLRMQEQQRIKQEILKELEQQQQQETQETVKNEEFIGEQINLLIDEGHEFLNTKNGRNEFLAYATRYPVFEGDKLNFSKIMELYQLQKKIQESKEDKKKAKKKGIAAKADSSQNAEMSKSKVQTSASLRGKSWRDFK